MVIEVKKIKMLRTLHKLKGDAILLLFYLKDIVDEHNQTTITNAEIAAEFGFSYRTANRNVEELDSSFLIKRDYKNECQNDCKRTITLLWGMDKTDIPTPDKTVTPDNNDNASKGGVDKSDQSKCNSIINNKGIEGIINNKNNNSINNSNSNSMDKSDNACPISEKELDEIFGKQLNK